MQAAPASIVCFLGHFLSLSRTSTLSHKHMEQKLVRFLNPSGDIAANQNIDIGHPKVDPPSRPRKAIVLSWRAFASCNARSTFLDLPDVVRQISKSPGRPKAATWRAKISSKP